jgi:hypothetical protein
MPQQQVADVPQEIAILETLPLSQLRARWAEAYGTSPPTAARAGYLLRGIAYRIQEKVFGGLSPAVLRRLEKLAPGNESRRHKHSPPTRLKPGSRLLREWQGTTYEVTVTETGYVHKEQSFKSLSEIARVITGTRWSGPLFFGLKSKSTASEPASARTFVVDLATQKKAPREKSSSAHDAEPSHAR